MDAKILYRNIVTGATFILIGPPEVQARMGKNWIAQ